MNIKKIGIAIGLALGVSITPSLAQQVPPGFPGYTSFTTGNAVSGFVFGTTNFVVASSLARGIATPPGGSGPIYGETPVATYLAANSDLAGSILTLWSASGGNSVTTNNFTTTNCVVTTNGFVVGNPMVIKHVPSDLYDIRIVSAINTVAVTNIGLVYPFATNVTYAYQVVANSAPTYTCTTNDQIFGYVAQGTLLWGASTNSIGPASFIFSGQYQTPFLMSINYTTSGQIRALTGTYQ